MISFQALPKVSWRKILFLCLISGLVLFIIFKTTVNIRSFSKTISEIDLEYFWLAFATIPPSIFLIAMRWHLILKASGYTIKFRRIFLIASGGLPFIVVPGKLGDFIRSYPLRNEIPVGKTIVTIILEKIIDVCTLLIYAGVGLFILRLYVGSAIAFFISFATIPCLIVFNKLMSTLATQTKMAKMTQNASEILDILPKNKNYLFGAILCSMTNMSLSLLQFYWLVAAVHAQLPIAAILAFMPLSIFIGLIPVTLAGMGTRDAALIYLLSPYLAASQSLSISLLYALQGYWILAAVCLPFLYIYMRDKPISSFRPGK